MDKKEIRKHIKVQRLALDENEKFKENSFLGMITRIYLDIDFCSVGEGPSLTILISKSSDFTLS